MKKPVGGHRQVVVAVGQDHRAKAVADAAHLIAVPAIVSGASGRGRKEAGTGAVRPGGAGAVVGGATFTGTNSGRVLNRVVVSRYAPCLGIGKSSLDRPKKSQDAAGKLSGCLLWAGASMEMVVPPRAFRTSRENNRRQRD